jgi:D-arginine dehydrogenase
MSHYDVAIIGAGIAGASLAAEIARHASVVILEAEDAPGYHSTGRSAAFWHETYGGPGVHPLSKASLDWLTNPPEATGAETFLTPRGVISMARDSDRDALDSFVASFDGTGIAFNALDHQAMLAYCPGLRPEWRHGIMEQACADIDVAGVHQAYLRIAKHGGAELQCRAGVETLRHAAGRWHITTRNGDLTATTIVNAAGAWADSLAALAGTKPLGITPYRRTMAQLRFDREVPSTLPLMFAITGDIYFKGDGAGGVWLSPHDETPSDPCDAAPEELDVAIAIDRLESIVDWQVRGVSHKWAGLRSFAPDRLPVYGFDTHVPNFFWCAGQGGFGIQTAPAAAKIAASQLLGSNPDLLVAGIDPAAYSPLRFA